MRLACFFAVLPLFCAGLSTPARADERADAKVLFGQARVLMKQGAFAQACPKLEQSHALAPRLGTLINLAACYESLGKIAAAWSSYQQARQQARADNQPERERFASERIEVLRPRLPYLTVSVAGRLAPGQRVMLDGTPLVVENQGERLPIDPGEHLLEVTAPGRRSYRLQFVLDEAQERSLVVAELQPLPAAPTPAPKTSTLAKGSPPAPKRSASLELPLTPAEDDSGFFLEVGLFAGYLHLSPGIVNPYAAFSPEGSKEAMGGGTAGVQLLAGYRFSRSLQLGGRVLVGPRFGGGLIGGLGPALQLRVAEPVWLGFGALVGGGNYSIDRNSVGTVTGTVGIGFGPLVEVAVELAETEAGVVVINTTPFFLLGLEGGTALTLPLGAAFRFQ